MKNYRSQFCKGFTLIEALVYIGVLVFIGVAVVMTYLSLDIVLLRNQMERELTSTAEVALERILRDIRSADSLDVGLSTLGTSPGVLVLQNGATTTEFSLIDGKIQVEVSGAVVGPLVPDTVTVESLVFRRYQNVETDLVRITLTLQSENRVASTTRTYFGSAVLRGTYE